MKYHPPPVGNDVEKNQETIHKNGIKSNSQKKILKKKSLLNRLKTKKTKLKKKNRKFRNEEPLKNQKKKLLIKKFQIKKKSLSLKKGSQNTSFLQKKPHPFVIQSHDFDPKTVKKRFFFLGSFFLGVLNVIVNHFYFLFQLYDNSLFRSLWSVVCDFLLYSFKLYNTFWSVLLSLIGSTSNVHKGRLTYGRYFFGMQMLAYFFCTYIHFTASIYIFRNFPFIKDWFWLPGLTNERWSYQVVNRLLFYLLNKNLRQTLFKNAQDKYDEIVIWTAQTFINFGTYFVGLKTDKVFEDADPRNEPNESPEYYQKKANRKRSWEQSFLGKYFSSNKSKTEKKKKIMESSPVLEELSKAIHYLKPAIPLDEIKDGDDYSKIGLILSPYEISTINLYSGIDNLYYQLRTKFSLLGHNFRTSFDKILGPIKDAQNKKVLLLYTISALQALCSQYGIDTTTWPIVGRLLEDYKKSLYSKGLYFQETEEGLVLVDRGFEKNDLDQDFLQENL